MAASEQEGGAEKAPLAPGLYLVATPIGNLEDMTLRALRVLRTCDRVACEDTRQTQKLLNHYGISVPTVSYHLHNETGRTGELVKELVAGARIALVTDAGTPAICDPGAVLVAGAIEAGVPVYPIPGANAAISAFSASGLLVQGEPVERFRFHGFLPAKEGQRRTVLEQLREEKVQESATAEIFYEAPHRILHTLADVEQVFGAEQVVVLARELTKVHEEFLRGGVREVRETLAGRASVRGEMVLMFVRETSAAARTGGIAEEVRGLIARDGVDEREALKRVAKARGLGKSEAYRELQRERGR